VLIFSSSQTAIGAFRGTLGQLVEAEPDETPEEEE
jgi:hypothetical protein